MTETQTSTWADFHARKRLLMAVSLLGPIVALVVASGYVETHGRMGLAWPLLAWAAATVYAAVRLQAFRCPRCQRRFFRRSPPLLALRARQCVNCSLPKD